MNTWIRALATSLLFFSLIGAASAQQNAATKSRARDLGVPFDGTPGPFNAITDVAGVLVGETTLISGEGKLVVGKGPIRTGVTAVLPRGKDSMNNPVFAGWFSQNGNGEMTGTTWVEESGFLRGSGDDYQYAQRGCGARRGDSSGASATARRTRRNIGGRCRWLRKPGTAG